MLWMLGIAGLVYLAWCAVLFLLQGSIIFPRHMLGPAPDRPAPAGTVVLTREIEAGEVVGWLRPAPGASADTPAPLVVFLHGNAERIDDQEPMVAFYHRLGVSVLLPEYRGYGRSDGTPSERAVVADSASMVATCLDRDDVDPERLVYHGRSLGGAVAVQLAGVRPPAGIILQSTFTGTAAFARGYGVPSLLIRHPFDSEKVLADHDGPVLVLHGRHDRIIPPDHARQLADIAGTEPVLFDAGHNDFPGPGEIGRYFDTLETFWREHGLLPEEGMGSS